MPWRAVSALVVSVLVMMGLQPAAASEGEPLDRVGTTFDVTRYFPEVLIGRTYSVPMKPCLEDEHGEPVKWVPVRFELLIDGDSSWSHHSSVTTDGSGCAAPPNGPALWTTHHWRAVYDGSDTHEPAVTDTATVEPVRHYTRAVLTSHTAEDHVFEAGQNWIFYGRTDGIELSSKWVPLADQTVHLQRSPAGVDKWTTVATTQSGPDGRWTFTFRTVAGTYDYRGLVPGDEFWGESDRHLMRMIAEKRTVTATVLRGIGTVDFGTYHKPKWEVFLGDTAPPPGPRTLEVWFRPNRTGEWKKVSTISRTLKDGHSQLVVSPEVRVRESGKWRLKYLGTATEKTGYTPSVTASVRPKITGWPTTSRTYAKSTSVSKTITVAPANRQQVLVQYKKCGTCSYTTVKTAYLNSSGQYTVKIPTGWAGTRYYRVVVPKSSVSVRGATKSWKITRK